MQETPRGRTKEPAKGHRHLRTLVTTAWGLAYVAVLGGAVVGLTGSLMRQLYTPVALLEPADAGLHTTWCVGHLVSLKVELDEATLQEMARGHVSYELTRTERARRRTWSDRLADLRQRCGAKPELAQVAQDLAALAQQYDGLVDSLSKTRQTQARDLDRRLASLTF